MRRDQYVVFEPLGLMFVPIPNFSQMATPASPPIK